MISKFNAGELVVLQSKSMPQYNGEYIVEAIIRKGDKPVCRLSGKVYKCTLDQFYYLLDKPLPHVGRDDNEETFWLESALRKKHEGSDFSFTELVDYLKNKIVEKI